MLGRTWNSVVAGLFVAGALACGSDTPTESTSQATRSAAAAGGTDTTGTSSNPTPTSTGPVASVTLTPAQLSVAKGNYAGLTVNAYDAKGVRVAGKRATWVSSNVNVVALGDTGGVVFGKDLGNAVVTATIDGISATSSVTVVAAPPPPPPPQPPVASFSLRVKVAGFLGDSTLNRTDPVAGATVKLKRVGGISGDSLTAPIDAGTATTDAAGQADFANLPGGTYSVEVSPPAGSPYRPLYGMIAPPRESKVQLVFNLSRRP